MDLAAEWEANTNQILLILEQHGPLWPVQAHGVCRFCLFVCFLQTLQYTTIRVGWMCWCRTADREGGLKVTHGFSAVQRVSTPNPPVVAGAAVPMPMNRRPALVWAGHQEHRAANACLWQGIHLNGEGKQLLLEFRSESQAGKEGRRYVSGRGMQSESERKGQFTGWLQRCDWGHAGFWFSSWMGLYYFLNLFFNWRIIALQCCVGFSWITMWISCKHTYICSLLSLPLTLPRQVPALEVITEHEPSSRAIQLLPAGHLFTRSCMYVRATLSVHPTLSFPTVSKVHSLRLRLYSCPASRFISTINESLDC